MINYIAAASHVSTGTGTYTAEEFKTEYPQFTHTVSNTVVCWVPDSVLASFVSMANATITPDQWLDMAHHAAGLFVAHKSTLYLRSYKSESSSAEEAAASGQVIGTVKSAAMGDVNISYDDSGAIRGTETWGDLNATTYGQELASMARLIGIGGSYVL